MGGNNKWFEGKKCGFFAHYLAAPAGNTMDEDIGVREWNKRVNSFDVETLARQLKEAGADYMGITIGQNSGYYCSPNPVYDELVGISPSKCSERDLVADLAKALSVYEIDLLAYLPSGAPDCDKIAMERLEWKCGDEGAKRLSSFQLKWQSVIREWSKRWGSDVKGWWIDGCYFSDTMYLCEEEPNFKSFAAALRSGNQDAVLTFNTGLNNPFAIETEESDYTAGEVGEKLPLSIAAAEQLQGKTLHVLSHLGDTWGAGNPRMPAQLAAGYTRFINEKGGVVSWDIPLSYEGTLSEPWMAYLSEIRQLLV